MKKLLLILTLIALLYSCKKTSPSITADVLNGKYVSYKSIDTVYLDAIKSHGIQNVQLESIYGDTLYTYQGASIYKITPNTIQNYNKKLASSDTLIFNSNISGIEKSNTDPIPFSYNIKTGYFFNGDNSSTYKIIKINSNIIEIIWFSETGIYISDVQGTYYIKQ